MEIVRAKKMNYSSSSADRVFSIDDLIIQIMQRLPLKQTVALQLLSKQCRQQSKYLMANWRSFYHPNPSSSGLLFSRVAEQPLQFSSRTYSYIPFSNDESVIKLQPPPNMEIVQSCNGLLLCTRTYDTSFAYFVCNPVAGTYSRLPLPLEHLGIWVPGNARRTSLAFDPDKSPHYKAVNVSRDHIYVYSSQTGVWTQTVGAQAFRNKFDYSQGVYCNGSVHWITEGYYFNMESYQLKNMPRLFEYGLEREFYFGESRGHLHCIDDSSNLDFVVVYELKKNYSRWFVKYRVDLSEAFDRWSETKVLHRRKRQQVLDVIRGGGRGEESYLVVMVNGIIARYNLGSETFEKLHQTQSRGDHQVQYCAFQYFMWDPV